MTKEETSRYAGNGWFWKPIAIALMSALFAFSLMLFREHWLIRDFITRAEAKEMVDTAPSLYAKDQKYIIETLSDIKKDVR